MKNMSESTKQELGVVFFWSVIFTVFIFLNENSPVMESFF
jgi:hypothetical protein